MRKQNFFALNRMCGVLFLLCNVALIGNATLAHTIFQQAERYDMRAEVIAVDKTKKRATLKHEPIKGYMDAMTMPFLIKDEKALEEMQAGDQIQGTLVVTVEGATWVEKITIISSSKKDTAKQDDEWDKPIGLMGVPGNKPVPPQPSVVSRYADPAGLYTCVMHLGIRTKLPGKCPKCGMDLVSIEPAVPEEFNLKLEVTPKAPVPNRPLTLHLTISNPRNGVRVKQFALMHDKLFHLFLVSQDLSDFQHIHPQQLEDGSFMIDTMLKRPGLYKVYADFYPLEGAPQMLQTHLATVGWQGDVIGGRAQLRPDMQMSKLAIAAPVTRENADKLGVVFSALTAKPASGLQVKLSFDTPSLIAGTASTLKFYLADAVTGKPVQDLIPYLSAWAHMLILSEDLAEPVHSHPEVQIDFDKPITEQHGGPDLTFDALFPAPGNYRIWAQFLRGQQVFTVAFDVVVVRS